jgi:hypothetical protein
MEMAGSCSEIFKHFPHHGVPHQNVLYQCTQTFERLVASHKQKQNISSTGVKEEVTYSVKFSKATTEMLTEIL